ncbi:MAG: Gfo/Idh/MocA family oxidoreductase [Endozoicomonas sp.]
MKVLVCGTNYGATYLRALSMGDPGLSAAGILSTGSERSRAYASGLNIPHFTSVKEIPEGSVDIACVAVGSDVGNQLTLELLERGIHVLAEHPLDAAQMKKALDLASEKKRVFQVNGHFADLTAPATFFQSLQTARQQGPVLHFSLSANLRTLYSALDMLGRAQGSLKEAKVRSVSTSDKPEWFKQLTIDLESVSVSLLCQNFSSEKDDGSANLINHRFSATLGHGDLLLAESNGPVLWFPTPLSMAQESWQSYLPVDLTPVNSMQLMQQRDYANLMTLRQMSAVIHDADSPLQQQPDYLMDLAQLWQDCVVKLFKPDMHHHNQE